MNLRLDAPKSEGGEGELSKFQETERLINPMAGDSEVLTHSVPIRKLGILPCLTIL